MSDTLKDKVRSDLHDAIRAKEKVRAATLRMVLTAITNEEVAGDEHRELTDDDVLRVITREAKKRREAAAAFSDAGRRELAETEEAELAILTDYLPTQLSDDELGAIVADAVAEVGATGMQQMGQVMKLAQAKAAGRAEGGRVAALVKQALQS
ncbi:MAG: GatB/YqeY domain-containing protein [Actinomycetales bacterium]|nr:GatB/YqeY domain-containing protein [Tetrasphaera sp.]NLW99550.1 GatB/YqeY domain-containing protein [Actinomycetales bacterium]